MTIFDRYEICELVAVGWSDDMAERFPNADHTMCRQEFQEIYGRIVPTRCRGWHCNRCGKPTNCQGGHDCPDRPAA